MRKATQAIHVPRTEYVEPRGRILGKIPLALPQATARDEQYFTNAVEWRPRRWPSDLAGSIFDAEETCRLSRGAKSAYLPFWSGQTSVYRGTVCLPQPRRYCRDLVREVRFSSLDESSSLPEADYASMFSRPVQPTFVRWQRRMKRS